MILNARTRRPFGLVFACATVGIVIIMVYRWRAQPAHTSSQQITRWTRQALLLRGTVNYNVVKRPAGLHPSVRIFHTDVIRDESCIPYRLPWDDPSGTSLILCTYTNERDPGVSAVVRKTQMWEPTQLTMVMAALKMNDKESAKDLQERISLVDIGCNIGTFTVVAAALGYDVLCVDAMEESLEHVQTSLIANELTEKATIVHNALSDTYEEMMVEFCSGCGPASSKISAYGDAVAHGSNNRMKSRQSVAQSVHMDDIIPLLRTRRVVIKMDIEAAEGRAIRGASKFFDQTTVLEIMMEWEHVKHKTADRDFILQFMGERGFRAYKSLFDHVPLAWKDNMTWPSNVFWHKRE